MARFNVLDGTNAGPRVAIVAAGVISPLGFGLEETLASLRNATETAEKTPACIGLPA